MRHALLVILPMLFSSLSVAQTADATHIGNAVNLGGNWLYHSGDDPNWSRPDISETDWRVVSTNVGWYEHGNLWRGYYWYRLHVQLPSQHPKLQLLFNYVGNPY